MTEAIKRYGKVLVFITTLFVQFGFALTSFFEKYVKSSFDEYLLFYITTSILLPLIISGPISDSLTSCAMSSKRMRKILLKEKYINGYFYIEWFDLLNNRCYIGNALAHFEYKDENNTLIETSVNFNSGEVDETPGEYVFYPFENKQFIGRFKYKKNLINKTGLADIKFIKSNAPTSYDVFEADITGMNSEFVEFHQGKLIPDEEIIRYKKNHLLNWRTKLLNDLEHQSNRIKGQSYYN